MIQSSDNNETATGRQQPWPSPSVRSRQALPPKSATSICRRRWRRPTLRAIKDAFAKYAVLIFPDQHLSQDQHLDFARHFGPLETTIALHRKDAQLRVRKEFADVSNLDPENKVWGKESRQRMFQLGNRLWHTD